MGHSTRLDMGLAAMLKGAEKKKIGNSLATQVIKRTVLRATPVMNGKHEECLERFLP